ncbi:MAG: J domain-containing protein [Verrucomicrobiales bacterium]|nr:J domain-containing protein [Verrucomicrobiales bacterium]
MEDPFALLELPRHPWVDATELKEHFLARSAAVHPDRQHDASEAAKAEAQRRFADLNAAYNCLRDARERLHRLLTLESGGPPKDVQRIPPGTMDLFVEIGQACREVDGFLEENAAVTSPMLKVKRFEQGLEWTDRLQALLATVGDKRGQLEEELRSLNVVWDAAPPVGSPARGAGLPLERLEQIYRILSYVSRWTDQLQERVVRLAM